MNGIVVFVDLISTTGVTINTWEGGLQWIPFYLYFNVNLIQ